MTHYTVTIIVPPSEIGSEPDYIDRLMSPYYVELTVAPYIAYSLEQAEKDLAGSANRLRLIIQRQESSYDLDNCREKLGMVLATTPEEAYRQRLEFFEDFDLSGRPISTCNPAGKWDWYVIGGRWDGWVHDRDSDRKSLEDNSASVEEVLARSKVTDAIITPDGLWHEPGQMGWFGILHTEVEDWDDQARAILSALPDHRVVILDAHV